MALATVVLTRQGSPRGPAAERRNVVEARSRRTSGNPKRGDTKVELIQRALDQLPVPLQGLFVLLVGAGFGVMAFFAVYADESESDRAWPAWLLVFTIICIAFVATGLSMMFGG